MKKTIIAVAVLMCACSAALTLKGPAARQDVRDKARYYYLEAVNRQVDGDEAEAYELYKKAYQLDPTYVEAESAYGSRRLTIETDTFQSPEMLMASLAMMRPYIDTYPGDFFEAAYYAYLAAHLDTIEEAIRIYERADSLSLPRRLRSTICRRHIWLPRTCQRPWRHLTAMRKWKGSRRRFLCAR